MTYIKANDRIRWDMTTSDGCSIGGAACSDNQAIDMAIGCAKGKAAKVRFVTPNGITFTGIITTDGDITID